MRVIHEEGARPIKIWADEIEASAMEQLHNISKMPFICKNGIAAMPDSHWGNGTCVGSVIATRGAIIPASVGVDIGCGMMALRLEGARAEHLPDNLKLLRTNIERDVPTGFDKHTEDARKNHAFARLLHTKFEWIEAKYPTLLAKRKDSAYEIIASQFGTLGGGNHFIELCADENQDLWVMLHSGSRGIGNMIGQHFIALAKKDMERHFINLPDQDLAYLSEGTEYFDDYCNAVDWAQTYAAENRAEMMRRVLLVVHKHLPQFNACIEAVECHHNYVEREHHFGENLLVTRKGAVRARLGDMGIIPGSMGTKSYIVRGKGNPESYNSCSHGAGRAMGRKAARLRFTVEDLIAQTEGVECRKDNGVLDEIPGSYKNIDVVMENQKDLVEIVHTLRAVLCVKGG